MVWQDIVITVCQVVAVFSLLPSISSDDKPALKTSIMNVCLVCVISFCMLTLELWFSSFTAGLIAVSWGILALQKYNIDKSKKS